MEMQEKEKVLRIRAFVRGKGNRSRSLITLTADYGARASAPGQTGERLTLMCDFTQSSRWISAGSSGWPGPLISRSAPHPPRMPKEVEGKGR